ncbi:RNA polymerase sigma factor [Chitinophaga sp. 30R24]|uniref:RNA polymerase sigma factor n=1 Tax=Chitinophaga sp. 30R24 TaxID=3248838 RepID=UPI003B8FE410
MNTNALNEKDCWTRFQNGAAAAYRQIYEKHWNKLFNYSYQIIQDYDDCKDLMQDYFTQLWLNRASFPVPDNVEAFLMSLLKYRVIDFLRKKHIRQKHTILFNTLQRYQGSLDGSDPLLFNEELEKFYNCFSQLPEQLRTVFRLHYIDAMSIEEIAAASAKSKQTIRNQLNIAATRLKKQLKNNFPAILF